MVKLIARIWAKLSYVFVLESEARKSEINAVVARTNAQTYRSGAEAMHKEANGIEQRINELAVLEDKGYWLCENGHELPGDALTPADGTLPACNQCGKPLTIIKRELMSGQEKYESDKERKEAEKMVAEKRGLAQQQEARAAEAEQTATTLEGMAANSRTFAQKIREI